MPQKFLSLAKYSRKTFLYKQKNEHESWQRSSDRKKLIDTTVFKKSTFLSTVNMRASDG